MNQRPSWECYDTGCVRCSYEMELERVHHEINSAGGKVS